MSENGSWFFSCKDSKEKETNNKSWSSTFYQENVSRQKTRTQEGRLMKGKENENEKRLWEIRNYFPCSSVYTVTRSSSDSFSFKKRDRDDE